MSHDFTYTSKCTDDWHLGEVCAVEGRAPYPMPAGIYSQTAFESGFHLAYKKIHGRSWSLDFSGVPADAIIPIGREWPPIPNRFTNGTLSGWLAQAIRDFARAQGLVDFEQVLSLVNMTAHYPQHGECPLAVGGSLALRKGKELCHYSFQLDFFKGEYDLRPWFTTLLPRLREAVDIWKDRQALSASRQVIADNLQRRLEALFGCTVYVRRGDLDTDRLIDSISLTNNHPSNEQVHRLLAAIPHEETTPPTP